MNEALFKVLLTLIPVLGAIITYVIVPYIRSKMTTEQLNQVTIWVERAVKAAEMMWTASGKGTEKKAYVTEFLKNTLSKMNLNLTDDQLDALIEAAVKELKIEETIKEG